MIVEIFGSNLKIEILKKKIDLFGNFLKFFHSLFKITRIEIIVTHTIARIAV